MAATAPSASPRQAGKLLRRRRVDRLSTRQLADLRDAFAAVQSLSDQRGYAYWAGLEAQAGQHNTPLFLPWQRAYLHAFERALRELVPRVSLPWWDWATRPAIPDAFANERSADAIQSVRPTSRAPEPRTSPVQPRELAALMELDDFGAFAERLEAVHAAVHTWVGGDMAQVASAAYDPLFWPLTAMVDQIWWSWQLRHPDSHPHPELLEAPLEPFGMRVVDVLDATVLGYEYDVRRPAPRPGGPEVVDEPWRPTLAGYVSDAVPELPVDHLKVQDDVEALCAVVASREVTPPLSIGLFGDWGAGKSTFMGLMRERIDELAERSRAAGDRSSFCGGVQQITFNAWHYADDNLWASLVTHIFEELGVPRHYEAAQDGPPPSGLLGALGAARSGAEATIAAADHDEELATEALENLPADTPRAIAHEIVRSPGAAALADDPVVKEARADVVASVGEPAARALDDVVQSTDTFARLVKRVVALRQLLRKGTPGRWRVALSATVLLVGVLVLVVMPLVGVGTSWLSGAIASVAGLAATMRQLFGAEQLVSKSVGRIEERVDAERQQALQTLEQAHVARSQGAQELEAIESGAIVRRYFADRATTEYRARLGLISTVRRDFDDLQRWLQGVRDLPPEQRARFPQVDRVVLYVDDLDRCSTRRVVEVLEAVHLLLALDLFVVVVGVDPRWLLSSLERHYAAQFARRGDETGARASWATTPQHYLEKIFQIPFNLRPMDRVGFTDLVTSLLPLRTDEETDGGPAGPGAAPQPPVDSGSSFPPGGPQPSPYATPDTPQDDEELQPAGLTVEPAELDFLSELSGLVPTPRATKRLVNTYRLIRAPLDPASLRAVVEEQHRVVLLLLALLVGFPSVTPRLFGALLAEQPGTPWAQFVARLRAAPDRSPDWTRAVIALDELTGATDLPDTVEPFRAWVPTVARYSFETARLAPVSL